MADSQRIDELQRRVRNDPASIAFAQLAEEYRRSGRYHDAVRVCRAGLPKHPSYLSARLTLGRALIELGLLDDAERELEQVVRIAPGNIAAERALGEIAERRTLTAPGNAGSDAAILDAPAGPAPIADGGTAGDLQARSDDDARVLGELEAWLAAIVRDRERRKHGPATLTRSR